MRQTLAIFIDAYRELNAKRLFWFVLLISGIVVAAFAAVGVDSHGLNLLIWHFDSVVNSNLIPPDLFYKQLFTTLGIKIWLSWIAAILALISTAGMIPDFISGGAIELVLSKPIGRLRLFMTKYTAGLLFVTLQVAIFSVASFLVIGVRGGSWEPSLLWAIPIVVCFFSYLFAICVLLGVITRSTIAALLLTLLIWFLLFGLHTTEGTLLTFRVRNDVEIQALHRDIKDLQQQQEDLASDQQQNGPSRRDRTSLTYVHDRLESRKQELDRTEKSQRRLVPFHKAVLGLATVLPKTSETIGLLERTLISKKDRDMLMDERADGSPSVPPTGNRVKIDSGEVQRRIDDAHRSRSIFWIIGTSLIFEGVILAIASWIFCRRDF